MSDTSQPPPSGITFLAGFDRDLRQGLAAEIRCLWTHHSTALEGNTLTLGDTAFVLQEGLTVSGKSIKDHQEVIGHARAIDLVYAIIDQRREVTPDELHLIHRAVQTEVVVDAFAPIGRWKNESNGTTALLTSGKTCWHDYATVGSVPALMDSWCLLLAEVRKNRNKTTDLLDVYTDLHLSFTAIHPYADGNGRMARLMANIPVIEGDEPPVLVPLQRRRDYLMLMGDWSIARGMPAVDQALVTRNSAWIKLRAFFSEVSQPARELLATYRGRQRARGTA